MSKKEMEAPDGRKTALRIVELFESIEKHLREDSVDFDSLLRFKSDIGDTMEDKIANRINDKLDDVAYKLGDELDDIKSALES